MSVTRATPRPETPARRQQSEDDLKARIQAAWATLLDRADAIADDITLTLLDKEKEWYADQPELRADIRANTREHIRRGIRTMAGLAEPGEGAVHVWRDTGRRRAAQGVPMEHVLNAYTLGTRVLWEALVEQRDRGVLQAEDSVLLIAGQRVWAALDLQASTLIDAYRRESARLERQDRRRQEHLLERLIEGGSHDAAFLVEVREVLGFAPDEAVACVVGHFDGQLDGPLRAADDRLERSGLTSYWRVRGEINFGLVALGTLSIADLMALLAPGATGRVGVAQSPDGLAGIHIAYRLAEKAAGTLPRGTSRVVSVTERLPEVLLGASPDVAQLLVAETVGPILALPAQQEQVLVETLAALLAHHGSPTHAAETLFCHRNTVIYRMRQIEGLTGRSLGDARDRLLLGLALTALGR
ncbi:PucR family transcriptional regulator [Nocardioides pacificus]